MPQNGIVVKDAFMALWRLMIHDTSTAMNEPVFLPPPLAGWVSPLAQHRFATGVLAARAPEGDLAAIRAHYDAFNRARLDVARHLYRSDIADDTIGGIPVVRVTPEGGATNDRVLICLHGGAFMWGRGAGALVEAVPLAAVTGSQVIAVSYRLAPEHLFPAAVEDALACYTALCGERSSATIGVFGCSAGGILTAQLVARLIAQGGPLPGALAMLHGTGLELDGDLAALSGLLCGVPQSAIVPALASLPYFDGANPTDALVFPGDHPATLAHFPPSLLITGTRDFAAGAVATMHRRLLAAGRLADLVLFDGMWHAHHVDTDLPEARETFDIMARFFARHLG